jgi:hypothetical protein
MKLRYLLLASSLLLAGCSLVQRHDKVGVAISGVNYSDQPITYALSEPADPRSGGAEPIDPFGAGGTMCCFSLPAAWQPGIKVRVRIYDTRLTLVKDEVVDLPPYVDGKPGRLWAVHYQDGSVDVLSSEYDPPHAKWPGKIKGWPVPTIEYRRKLVEREIDAAKYSIAVSNKLLSDPNTSPEYREMARANLKFDTELLRKLEAKKP